MADFLGFDTSNYTTSAALYANETNIILQKKKLLPVKEGQVGIRQSDAVFEHVRQAPEIIEALFLEYSPMVQAVGASVSPRDLPDSYMPCFLVGKSLAISAAKSLGVPFYGFSHQAGHVAAALYSSNQVDLLESTFLAFHASGGTTELLKITPHAQTIMQIDIIGETMDLNAGQAVDRVGALLGLPFPAGIAVEKLAGDTLENQMKNPKTKAVLRGTNCSLSGLENRCQQMNSEGKSPEEIAQFLLTSLARTIIQMVKTVFSEEGRMPVVFAGGVLSNQLIQKEIRQALGGKKTGVFFAEPEFARDNAAGIALLTALRNERENHANHYSSST